MSSHSQSNLDLVDKGGMTQISQLKRCCACRENRRMSSFGRESARSFNINTSR
jgi:hypothetical protein